MRRFPAGVLAAFLLICFGQTSRVYAAAIVDFSLSAGGNLYEWSLPLEPTPDSVFISRFELNAVEVTTNGTTTDTGLMRFFLASPGGGFNFSPILGLDFFGPQLFTGTTADPTFVTGTFALTPGFTGNTSGTLTITEAAVPEPVSLLLFGTAGVGLGIRRFRRRA